MFADVLEMAPRAASPRKAGVPHAAATPPPRAPSGPSRRLNELRARLRWTMSRTCVPKAIQPRIIAFERGLGIAARLADSLSSGEPTAAALPASALTVPDLVTLAYRGLDAGLVDDALAVLGAVGMLLGGIPRAAFETALGLVHVGRNAEACECLTGAVEGMNDSDGFVSTLLAQLWFEAGDNRWIAVARRVLATGSDRDARMRCMELLASPPRG